MNNWAAPAYCVLFVALWRMAYEAANGAGQTHQQEGVVLPQTCQPEVLSPDQKEWAEKAVKGYARAQEKKWRRWHDAMFERST